MTSSESNASTWGAGVRDLRKMRRLTQTELAERAGVTQPTISRLERGVALQIQDSTRVRIARALGVEPHELFPYLAPEQVAS